MSYPFLSAAALMALCATAPAHARSPAALLVAAVQSAAAAPAPTRAALIENARKSFVELDSNKDGTLSRTEVNAAQLRAQQRAAANIQQRVSQEFTKLDTDRNGQLSLAEFRAAAPAIRPNPDASAAAMARLDANKDGKITSEEFREPILSAFGKIDTNKDGTISAEERAKANR